MGGETADPVRVTHARFFGEQRNLKPEQYSVWGTIGRRKSPRWGRKPSRLGGRGREPIVRSGLSWTLTGALRRPRVLFPLPQGTLVGDTADTLPLSHCYNEYRWEDPRETKEGSFVSKGGMEHNFCHFLLCLSRTICSEDDAKCVLLSLTERIDG